MIARIWNCNCISYASFSLSFWFVPWAHAWKPLFNAMPVMNRASDHSSLPSWLYSALPLKQWGLAARSLHAFPICRTYKAASQCLIHIFTAPGGCSDGFMWKCENVGSDVAGRYTSKHGLHLVHTPVSCRI
jgi:hypothetical protein